MPGSLEEASGTRRRPRNPFSCKSCRKHRKFCDYRHPSQRCVRCAQAKGHNPCGPKLDFRGQPKSNDALSNTPVLAHAATAELTTAGHWSTSDSTNIPAASGIYHAEPSVSNRWARFHCPGYSKIEILTGIVAFQFFLVKTMWFFLRLEVAPTLDEQRVQQAGSVVTTFSWLRDEFHGLMKEMPAHQHASLEALRMLQLVGELALGRRPKPKLNHASRSTKRTALPAPTVISSSWAKFLELCPQSKTLLTCCAKVLTELDSGTFDFELLTRKHRDMDSSQSYKRASELFTWIFGVGQTGLPKLPIDTIPYWHLAYRNGEKEIAFEGWQEFLNSQSAVDLSDPFGVTLTLLAVEEEDATFLNHMSEREESIGRFRACGHLNLSPFEYAAAIDSEGSYFNLVRSRDEEADLRCLELAVSAGASHIVTLLTNSKRFDHLIIISYFPLICQAIDYNQPGIAWSLVELENYYWLWEGDPPIEAYAARAEFRKLNDLAHRIRKMDLSEPRASQALEQIVEYGPGAGI